jgi:hypothetical protein
MWDITSRVTISMPIVDAFQNELYCKIRIHRERMNAC